ncbi:kinase-like domain-containing protein [Hysterangium stoloniferum]|nr:kinase-like domain-containing protein [Hysterangium stoloniferum]
MSILSSLPKTLREWRDHPWDPHKNIYPRNIIWQHLESFFRELGLILWIPSREFRLKPPNSNERCPDPFAYRVPFTDKCAYYGPAFDHIKTLMCPARTMDDRDVLIRLVAKGEDGMSHLEALRRLAVGNVGSRGDNHTLPVLRLISLADMTFAVFPLMGDRFTCPWYHQLRETIDTAIQLLEGLAFAHTRLVAHRDIDDDNILINFCNGARAEVALGGPFRSQFPIRYYFSDFELAVCFDEDSSPSERVVSGIPISPRLIEQYGRTPAPEMLSGQPYCPFKCDVWQLGWLFCQTFNVCQITALPSEIKNLYLEMSAENPLDRPTAVIALERLRLLLDKTPHEVLQSLSLEEPPPPSPIPGI